MTLRYSGRWVTHHVAAAFAAAALALAAPRSRAADPQPYTVSLSKTGNDALDQALSDSSNLVGLRESAPAGPFALIERAREDARRFVAALHSFGYYKGSVDITIAGHGLQDSNLPDLLRRAPASPPVVVTVSPTLGPLFNIRKVDIQGAVPAKVRARLGLMPGAPARAQDVLAAQTRLLEALRAEGYALARVSTPTVIEDPAANSLDVTYTVKTGPRVDFGEISIKGLRAVNQNFVEKRLLIHSGEQFSPQAIEKARADLAGLGVFTSVRATTPDKLDAAGRIPIEFDVVERPTHAVSFSAAYSTDLGAGLTTTWSDRNLFGNAEQLNLLAGVQGGGSVEHGPAYNLSAQFIKPDFLERNQSLQADLGAVKQNLLAYDQNALSADVLLKRTFLTHWSGSIGLSGEAERIAQEGVTRDYTLVGLPLTVKLNASGAGNLGPDKLALNWQLALPDLTSALPTLAGAVKLRGWVGGPANDLAAKADLSGGLGPVGPISAQVLLQGLPGKPAGRITAQGVLRGSPLELVVAATRGDRGELRVAIERADWKSAHAQGALALAPGARFPLGRLDLRVTRLDDLRPLIGQPITGAMTASVVTDESAGHQRADLHVEAHDLGLAAAASTGHAELAAIIVDPLTHPTLNSRVVAAGKSASGVAASAQIELAGPEDALGLRAAAEVRDPGSGDLRLGTTGTVNAFTRVAALSRLQASWKNQELRLLTPAGVGFGSGLTVKHLRLGLGQGVIEANGRVSPTLDLTVAMRNLSADLAAVFAPGFAADGVLRGDAKFTGTPASPTGKLQLAATGLRLRSGPGRALPAANVTASADLAGINARIEARVTAGPRTSLSVHGQLATAPTAPIDLRAVGALDLAMLDPLLTASGRRAAGQVSLDARVGGSLRAPRISGAARLANATIEDFSLGAQVTDITGQVEAAGSTIRLTRLQGRAGPGTIGATGSVDVSAPGLPVNLEITARNARPLTSDLLTTVLNADMSLHGAAFGKLAVGGKIDVLHAEIGIPKRMPVQVPVLNVRVVGQPSPPPPEPPPAIRLDVTVAAHHVVVRGRGLFAELAGTVRVSGSTAALQPLGSFHMVRGNLSIAGQTLTFDKGQVGFDGGSLTDPSLDFVATSSTSTTSASLTITGTASNPKITLTSTPELPQDEVLAELLFHRNASSLSPFELAGIASSLAELSGATGVGDPLGGVRQRLGLEQLSIGTGANGGASLQAGRYVARGVYIGAQQGAGGNSSQAKVEIDIAKGLKVVGTVGTGTNATPGATPADSAGTSLGLKYQLEY